jgi:hypothetical protein
MNLIERRFVYSYSVIQKKVFFSFLKPLPFEAIHSNTHDDTSTDHAREVDSSYSVNLFVRRSLAVGTLVSFISRTEVNPAYFGHIIGQRD